MCEQAIMFDGEHPADTKKHEHSFGVSVHLTNQRKSSIHYFGLH